MPHKKGHDPQIRQAPSKATSLVRNIKYSNQPPYPFIRNLGVTAAALAPVPFGKGKLVGKAVKSAKKYKPPTPSNVTIQRGIDKRIQNLTKDIPMVKGGYTPKNYKNYPVKGLHLPAKNMKKYEVGGKLYGHFYKDGRLTNKYIDKIKPVQSSKMGRHEFLHHVMKKNDFLK